MLVTLLAVCFANRTSTGVVTPYDRRIVYVGRWDNRDPYGPKGSWSAVEARVEVKGSGVQARIQDSGSDWLQIEVDGRPTQAVQLTVGVQAIEVTAPKPGVHTFGFIKRTEPFVGTTQFLGFEPIGGEVIQARRKKRHLALIGASMTCGFGNEGATADEPFRPATENVYMSYGCIAARAVDADVEIEAWSGKKMWPDETMAAIYDLTSPMDPNSVYDFKSASPEAIVINLSTNDFSKGNPDEAGWTSAYKGFIGRLRTHYPKAWIYPSLGSMMTDRPESRKPLSTARGYLTRVVDSLRMAGDKHLRFLEFDPMQDDDGSGAGHHPSILTHERMAGKLEEALHRDLKW